MKNPVLTKYPFLKGTQCHKAIWLNYFSPELKTPPSEDQQMIISKGKQVGVLARQLFPGGIDLSENETLYGKELLKATLQALKTDNQIFYEAAFETVDQKMNFKADIFVKSNRKTWLIEVKSSTQIKVPEHILDLAFQYYVLMNSNYSGPKIEVYIAYLNKEYVREERLDIEKLFIVENVSQRIKDAQILIKNYLKQIESVLNKKNCPNIKVSDACIKPYKCAFYEHCWKDMPATTVFNISRLRKSKAAKMIEDGIVEPHQIPDDTRLSVEQWIEVNAARTGKPKINIPEIKSFLDSLELHKTTLWMDFESFQTPIPEITTNGKIPGVRPYQQICFQYCVLHRSPDGTIIRKEFLADRGKDPRKSFIQNLLKDTATPGNIIVYNQTFEIARLNELSKIFPEFSRDIAERISRIKDLLYPFAKKHYYSPLMNGSASIKSVLPVLVSPEELSYDELSVKNGTMAMAAYERFNQLSIKEQIETRRALLQYCFVDCMSMIKIADALKSLL